VKKQTLTAALLLTLFFSAIAGTVSVSRAVEVTAQEKTLAFLSDVVMIDLSKYNVTLRKDNMTYPAEYGGVPREDVTYRLQTDGIDLSADCVYLNQTFWRCQINLHGARPEDSMIYSQPLPADVVGLAKVVLGKYQAYTGSSRYQSMRDMLASVDKTENTSVRSDL
jgi:hypothetical protein